MNIEYINKTLAKFENFKKELSDDIDDFINSETEVSVIERWEIFCKAGRLGLVPYDSTLFDWSNGETGDWVLDRYRIYTPTEIEDRFLDDEIFEKHSEEHLKFMEAYMNNFKWDMMHDR